MSDQTVNPYFELKKADFINAATKKLEMKRNFKPELISEYAAINNEYVLSAAELIKLGIECFLEENLITIIIDGENYDVSANEIRNVLGEKQFDYVFSKKKAEDTIDAADDFYFDKSDSEGYPDDTQDYKSNSGIPNNMIMNPMMMNPFIAMMNYLMAPFQYPQYPFAPMQMQQATDANIPVNKNGDDELSDILKNINEIQNKVLHLEKEKAGTKEHVSTLKNRYETAKKDLKEAEDKNIAEREQHASEMQELRQIMSEMDEKYEFLAKEKSTLETDNKVLNDDLQKIKQESDQKDSTIGLLEAEKQDITAKLQEITKQAEVSENEKKNAESKIRELQAEKNKASSELDKVKKEMESRKVSNETHAAKYNTLKDERDTLKKEVQALRQEVEQMKSKNSSLMSENSSLTNEVKKAKEDSQRLQKNTQEYQKMAYIDAKTGLYNLNAFNQDFARIDKNRIIAAQIHICGMKGINETHGILAGNEIIKEVAEATKEFFPGAKIYRIYGDQFFITVENGNMNSVKGQLFDMKNKLMKDNISVAYGAAAGNESQSRNDIIEKINKEVKEMKQTSLQPQERMVSMIDTQEEPTPMQEEVLPEVGLDEELYNYMNQ